MNRVVRRSDVEYHLLCSICGEVVSVFAVRRAWFFDQDIFEGLIYNGIVFDHDALLEIDDRKRIFVWLYEDKISDLNEYVKKHKDLDHGIEAYCPDCDKLSCRRHYSPNEEWNEEADVLQRMIGTCPEKHQRDLYYCP